MAVDLDGADFWLPSQFLTEEDILMGFETSTATSSTPELGSPVDSVTETESDEDDSLAGLTQHVAIISDSQGLVLSRSPQSTLCPFGGSSGGNLTAPGSVAGEVAKMDLRSNRVQKGTGYFDSNRGLLCPPGKQSTPVSPNSRNSNFNGFQKPQEKQQPFQFQQLWSQQRKKGEDIFQGGRSDTHVVHSRGPPASTYTAVQRPVNRKPNPPAATTQNTGMRAIFLGPHGSKRESVGTGVFLPRCVKQTEPQKKSNKHACATVLVPEKVVQALKNINNAQSQFQSQPRIDSSGRSQVHSIDNSGVGIEIQLPSEWTY